MPLSPGFKVLNFTLFNREDTHASSVKHIGRFYAFKYEELLREEQQKKNSSKGTYYKTPSSSMHLVEVETEEGTESSKEREVAVADMAKLKHPINCKALMKPPKDQKLPLFTKQHKTRFIPSIYPKLTLCLTRCSYKKQ
ncbi:unnamed protein product [Prunus brigantina]